MGDDEADTDVDKAIAQMLWKNHRLFPPTSVFKNNWDSVMLAFVFYNCIFVPVELCFAYAADSKPLWHKVMDNCIDFLFISDIVLNFRTAYYNDDDDFEMILDKKLIRDRYMKSWFPLDLFASFPFEIIMQIFGADSGGSASALGVLKLPRLARLSRILKKLDKLKGANYVRVVHTLTSFLLLAHWIACIWYLAGVSAYNNKWDYNETHRWLRTENPSVGESWLQRIPGTPLTPQSKLRQLYLSSFYWALTMMMKSPFVGPDAIEEKIIGIFIIFFASLCFAFLLTTVSTLYAQLTTAGAVKRDQIGNLIRFTSFMGVPKDAELKLLHYFDALHNLTDGQDDVSVLSQLPYQLRLDVVNHIYRDTLLKAPMFNKCSSECASQLCIQMKPAIVLENDNVVVPGQVFDEVLFLMRGSLRVSGDPKMDPNRNTDQSDGSGASGSPDRASQRRKSCGPGGGAAKRGSNTAFTMIERLGTHLGGMSIFGKPPRAPYRVTANKKCQLVKVSCAAVNGVLAQFEADDKSAIKGFLETEHKTLVEAAYGGAKRRQSVAQAVEEAPVVAQGKLTAQQVQERVTSLETKLTSANEAILEIRKNVAAMVSIFKVLKTASVNAIAS